MSLLPGGVRLRARQQTGRNLSFLRPFFDRMCHPTPESRPSAVEALRQWRELRAERADSCCCCWRARNQVQWLKEHSFRAHVLSKALALVRHLGDRDRKSDTSSELSS